MLAALFCRDGQLHRPAGARHSEKNADRRVWLVGDRLWLDRFCVSNGVRARASACRPFDGPLWYEKGICGVDHGLELSRDSTCVGGSHRDGRGCRAKLVRLYFDIDGVCLGARIHDCAVCFGAWRGRKFPGVDKNGRGMVSKKGTRACDRYF